MSGKRGVPDPEDLVSKDRALWDEVKKTVKPLRKPRPEKVEPAAGAPPLPRETPRAKPAKQPPSGPVPREAPKPPPLAPLDRRTKSRVARGRAEIDARLDLHGFTLDRARGRLERFLASSQGGGAAIVLVITGKSGALRREVPHWLALPELRPLVIGFEEAASHHGGAGALYVRVRRPRV